MQLEMELACSGDILDTPDGLLGVLLRDQQTTAAERFARWHDDLSHPVTPEYRGLIPLSVPGPGEQYAFDVDLDACSGCKSCVAACHNLNGLEETELWRSVGLLQGGSTRLSVLQHVTAACHHCVEPACLDGCPVHAYEKDPVTGIVRHLDDQCIGCRYCILKCPYDVPKYSAAKGIVRKCDMCHTRLAAGEAPACAQACPNEAIRITVVNKQDVVENAEANLFLPGAPEPGYTLPSTTYRSARSLPSNLLPADYFVAAPQHAHWPLVWMLVLTQMSVGAYLVGWWLDGSESRPGQGVHRAVALACGFVGLIAAVGHLGRPWLAFRAVIGWRTSWLSREIIAFGLFAMLAGAYAALPWLNTLGVQFPGLTWRVLGAGVVLSGLAAVACSVMIYASTRRAFWNPAVTAVKFGLTCLVLGLPIALVIRLAFATTFSAAPQESSAVNVVWGLCLMVAAVNTVKLLIEASSFCWLRARIFTPLRRTALLMTGELRRATTCRFLLGLVGGILLPGALAAFSVPRAELPSPVFSLGLAVAILLFSLLGETLERYLFFVAVVAPKMPGAVAA